jgi:parallel beta-helix repeat protein
VTLKPIWNPVLVSLVSVAALLVASSAQARLHCGSVIRRDTTLHHDVQGCHGTALAVGRDRVTLDLGGHEVVGGGSFGTAAIKDHGHDHVEIEHGKVEGSVGILVADHANRVRVTHLRAQGQQAVRVNRSSRERIEHTALEGEEVVYLDHARRVRVTGSHLSAAEDGFLVSDSNDNVFRRDRVEAPHHIADLEGSNRNRITKITGTSTNADGIALRGSSANVVSRNSLGKGLFLLGSAVTITAGSDRNTVEANRVALEPIVVGGTEINRRVSSNNRLIDNRVTKGFIATERGLARNTLIAGNSVTDNAISDRGINPLGDGIHAGSPTSTVTGNVALRNKGHGIAAASGVIDGGGNRAAGNHTSPQCVNVACTAP